MDTFQFDGIVPEASVRCAVIANLRVLSIRDFIKHLCDKNCNDAAEVWRRRSQAERDEVQRNVLKLRPSEMVFKFPGCGQSEQPMATPAGLLRLCNYLPGEKAKNSQGAIAELMIRYFAGDHTLIEEINAVSNAPLAQLAQSEMAPGGPAVPVALGIIIPEQHVSVNTEGLHASKSPLDSIVRNAAIRFMVLDKTHYLSIRDIIRHICGYSINDSAEVWRRLSHKQIKLAGSMASFKFKGRGQSTQPLIDIQGALHLIMLLPGERAKHMRVAASDILSQFILGDNRIISEIKTNQVIGPMAALDKLHTKAKLSSSREAWEMPRVSYVYGTQSKAFPGLIKIGQTINVGHRLSSMNTSCAPEPHVVVAVAPTFDSVRDEAMAHGYFACSRKQGEFFDVTQAEVQTFFAEHIMARYQQEMAEYVENPRQCPMHMWPVNVGDVTGGAADEGVHYMPPSRRHHHHHHHHHSHHHHHHRRRRRSHVPATSPS
jgi:hypothetical protein